MQGKVPQIFGYSVVNIISGSMEDTIPEGSYILVKKVSPEEVNIEDIICFYSSDPSISGLPNTHRVVKDPIITDNGIDYVTMGDANASEDKYTAKGEDLIGRYVKPLDGLGAFVSMLDGGGMTVLFVALQLMVLAMVISTFLRARKGTTADATAYHDDSLTFRKDGEGVVGGIHAVEACFRSEADQVDAFLFGGVTDFLFQSGHMLISYPMDMVNLTAISALQSVFLFSIPYPGW
jgi:signal peptidase